MKKISSLLVLLAMMILITSVVQAKPLNIRAHLTQELPSVETLGQGQVVFQLDKAGESVSYRLIIANIENVTMAHIHISEVPGGDGPPAIWLYPLAPPASLIPGRFQGTLSSGHFMASDFVGPLAGQPMSALITAIEEGRAYVNVHTSDYSGGEIRGDLKIG